MTSAKIPQGGDAVERGPLPRPNAQPPLAREPELFAPPSPASLPLAPSIGAVHDGSGSTHEGQEDDALPAIT
jgi:hypothetical protein